MSQTVDEVEEAITREIEGPGRLLGYRAMQKKLRQVHMLTWFDVDGPSVYDSFNRIHFIFMLLTKIGMHSSHYSCFRPFVNPDNTSHYFGVKQVLQIEPANYIRIIIGHVIQTFTQSSFRRQVSMQQ